MKPMIHMRQNTMLSNEKNIEYKLDNEKLIMSISADHGIMTIDLKKMI